jgi:ABC-type Fe3+-siderophore transport system permease subunit
MTFNNIAKIIAIIALTAANIVMCVAILTDASLSISNMHNISSAQYTLAWLAIPCSLILAIICSNVIRELFHSLGNDEASQTA